MLYLTMRFATAIKQIQNLRAYHAGDKLFVEVIGMRWLGRLCEDAGS